MIYKFPQDSEPIRQGDLFRYIPKIDFDLNTLPVYSEADNQLVNGKLDKHFNSGQALFNFGSYKTSYCNSHYTRL
jgi:hypothetical protein